MSIEKTVRAICLMCDLLYVGLLGIIVVGGQIGIGFSFFLLLDSLGLNVAEFRWYEWLLGLSVAFIPMTLWRIFFEYLSDLFMTWYRFKLFITCCRLLEEYQDK